MVPGATLDVGPGCKGLSVSPAMPESYGPAPAMVMKPDELFNRRTLQMVIRRLDDQTLERMGKVARRYEH